VCPKQAAFGKTVPLRWRQRLYISKGQRIEESSDLACYGIPFGIVIDNPLEMRRLPDRNYTVSVDFGMD